MFLLFDLSNAFDNHLFNCILQTLTKIIIKLHEEEGNLLEIRSLQKKVIALLIIIVND